MKLNRMIDHTLLKPESTPEQIKKLCEEAKEYNFKSVCVNPCYVKEAYEILKDTEVAVCTVIGFPLGANTTAVKVFEAKDAIDNGASEIDMVINIGLMKAGNYSKVEEEIKAVVEASGDNVVKVIIETALLSKEEIVQASKCAMNAGADFVKTSTGFSIHGAKVEDVKLMKETVGDKLEVKASGGIRDLKTSMEMIDAGATRLGVSAGIAIYEEYINEN